MGTDGIEIKRDLNFPPTRRAAPKLLYNSARSSSSAEELAAKIEGETDGRTEGERERVRPSSLFFSRSAGGEPINKTADERDEEQRGKSERRSDLSLTNFQRLPDRPTDWGTRMGSLHLGAHLGGRERKGFMSCENQIKWDPFRLKRRRRRWETSE